MTILSPTDVAYLRTRPHRTDLQMVVYRPSTVMAATVNSVGIARGAVSIPFTTVSGSYTNIVGGMTLLIGSTVGGEEYGRLRIRSTTSSVLAVAENSIIWQNGAQLTVLKFFEPWPVFPRIVLDGGNVPTYYKDWDIAYTNQNSVLDPVPVMGSDMVALIDDNTGQALVYFNGAASYDLNTGGSISTYAWTFEGGTPSTSASATAGIVSWDTPGDYIATLTVTNAAGKSFTGRRHICIRTQPGGSDPPIVNWGMDAPITTDYTRGDWEGRFWMLQDAGENIIYPHALVILISKNWYGSTNINLGGSQRNRRSLWFSGYVRSAALEINPEYSKVSFSLSGMSGRLSAQETFSVSIEDKASPADWTELKDMTVQRAVNHYIRWHTTIYAVSDVTPNDPYLDTAVQFADYERSPLYQSIDQFISSTILGHAIVDRQGRMWLERKVDIIPVADRTLGTVMSIKRADWMENIAVNQVREEPVSYAEASGIHYSGGGVFNSLISIAPGDAPLYEGTSQATGGLVLVDQTVTNQLVGNMIADVNKEFKEVSLKMSGDYPVFDIAPQERVLMNLVEADSYLQLVWTDKPFIPRKVSINYDREKQMMTSEVTLEEESDGPPGIPGPYPGQPPFSPPPTAAPPLVPPAPTIDPYLAKTMVIMADNSFTYITSDFDSAPFVVSPSWTNLGQMFAFPTFPTLATDKDHGSRLFGVYSTNGVAPGGFCSHANVNDPLVHWTLLHDDSYFWSLKGSPGAGYSLSSFYFGDIKVDPSRAGYIAITGTALWFNSGTSDFHYDFCLYFSTNAGASFTFATIKTASGLGTMSAREEGSISFGAAIGYVSLPNSSHYNSLWRFNSSDGSVDVTQHYLILDLCFYPLHAKAFSNDNFVLFGQASNPFAPTHSGIQLGSPVLGADAHLNQLIGLADLDASPSTFQRVCLSPNGSEALGIGAATEIWRIPIGGTTWANLGSTTGLSKALCLVGMRGPAGHYAVTGEGGLVKVTHDSGSTWIDQTGDLSAGTLVSMDFF